MTTSLDTTLLKGGANNQVHLVEGNPPYIIKKYFYHKEDKRDRLNHEYSFLEYAWEKGIRCIPEPIAKEKKKRLGVYSYIKGRAPTPNDINADAVEQALTFFTKLNQEREHAELPLASEACFSSLEYIERVENKLKSFLPLEKEIESFFIEELLPKWEQIKNSIEQFIVPTSERCISPSDFGFHNAIVDENKKFYFIDFEYAGWDDPAKTICDFFLQPRIPVPFEHHLTFSKKVIACTSDPKNCLKRSEIIFPLCKIRWCLIMLGIFSHAGKKRRKFSLSPEKKEEQLNKAKKLFITI